MKPINSLSKVSPVILHGCIRCNGPLDLYDEFPRCVTCGWEDYRDHGQPDKGANLPLSGSVASFPHSLAYRGDSSRFKFSDRISARMASTWRDSAILCPYDGTTMRHSGPASPRTPGVHAYTCKIKKHRVRVWRQSDGNLAWR